MATIGELVKDADKNVDIGIVIDESGSMEGMEETVIKCFNDFLKEQKQNGDDAFITISRFNNDVKFVLKRRQLSKAEYLSKKDYRPYGTTALYDAIYDTIKLIEGKTKNDKVIVAIITDGYENSSKKCDIKTLKENIQEKERLGWKFLFLASNIDVKETAKSFGINLSNAIKYDNTCAGYETMCRNIAASVLSYRENARSAF